MKKNNTQKKKNANNKFAQETNNWTGKKNSQKVAKVQMPCVTKKFDENRKMNIGLFVDSFFPMIDGVVNVVDNYAKRLCKFANVTVFTTAPRDKNVVESLDNLLQFEEDSHAARMVYDEALDRYVSEKVPNIVRKVSPSKSVTEETKRLVRFIGHGLSIEGKNLIIPAGGAIALPIEKREPPKRTFDERRQEYEEKRKQREQAGKVVVEGSPIIERFITWAKSQDWFPTWATLYQKTFNEDPDSHLHSLVVAKALNNSIPGRGLYKVLYHFDFPFEVFEWNEKIKEAENGFITADRKAIVDKLADDVASAPDGFLLKTARQVFEEFGLDADHVTSGLYLLA